MADRGTRVPAASLIAGPAANGSSRYLHESSQGEKLCLQIYTAVPVESKREYNDLYISLH